MFDEKTQYMIHSYKYNGWLYRIFEYPYVVYENDESLCFFLPANKVQIIKAKEIKNENNKKKFFLSKNSHPMIWFFFTKKWFNFMVTIKPEGLSFYINLASPFFIEEKALKYIDFDLDIKINTLHEYKIIDKDEFKENSRKWKYSPELIKRIYESQDEIVNLIKKGWFKNLLNSEDLKKFKVYIKNKFSIDF